MAKKKLTEEQEKKSLFIDPREAAKLVARACEMRMHAAEANLAKLTHDVLLAKLDPKGLISEQEAKFRNCSSEYQQAKANYETLKKEIGDRLGIDLSRFSYDEDTGELIPLEA